jgi:hypothetical protein
MSRHHDFSGAALRVNDMAAAVACVRDAFLRRKNET